MRQLLTFVATFSALLVYGQAYNFDVKFKPVDSKLHFYHPNYQTETPHIIQGIGNLYKPVDSISWAKVYITVMNMDEWTQDSLISKTESTKNKLKIIVDTSQYTWKELRLDETHRLNNTFSSYPRQLTTKDRKGNVYIKPLKNDTAIIVIAQPVFIANLSNEIKYLKGYSGYIHVTQQARDKNNRWRDIETTVMPSCGMVKYICELKPNDFVLTTVCKFNGSFETQLRVKLEANTQTYYSNSFVGYIDYRQIENPKIKIVDYALYERL